MYVRMYVQRNHGGRMDGTSWAQSVNNRRALQATTQNLNWSSNSQFAILLDPPSHVAAAVVAASMLLLACCCYFCCCCCCCCCRNSMRVPRICRSWSWRSSCLRTPSSGNIELALTQFKKLTSHCLHVCLSVLPLLLFFFFFSCWNERMKKYNWGIDRSNVMDACVCPVKNELLCSMTIPIARWLLSVHPRNGMYIRSYACV